MKQYSFLLASRWNKKNGTNKFEITNNEELPSDLRVVSETLSLKFKPLSRCKKTK